MNNKNKKKKQQQLTEWKCWNVCTNVYFAAKTFAMLPILLESFLLHSAAGEWIALRDKYILFDRYIL